MGVRTEVGPRVYTNTLTAATASYTPPYDRAALVRRFTIENPSAADNWQVLVSGREIMRFRVLTTGNQRMLFIPTAGSAYQPNFFDWARDTLGIDPSIPVPLGMTITIQSVGGATADILIEAEEHDAGDMNNAGQINHYRGTVFLLPIFWYLNASVANVGTVQLDTQVAPPWVPALFNNANIPVGWKAELLALFTEGAGVNTFSGAANHQSISNYLQALKDQVQIFTRVGQGVPDVGAASAAGSANTVYGQRSAIYPPFQFSNDNQDSCLNPPIVLTGGESLQLFLNVTGDVTGGASYSGALQVAVARVTVPSPGSGSF